ncbi:HAD-superfamily hydrolase, subfamily IA, variant 1 [Cyanobacterium stanieri PCC 7202]|uniref:HAD-superfamily hydrolase, subfamily IA, variant 1 n=1 Tax=Cyanobacterium stanieri (strain ATCC 29140 / PCC 7202) TaxID=292563 RepID=K9YQJ0_CYASC|nr:HAD-superfamily hydrolase, subfamily IA, variant 1 [Cyanobacterium stanieri PCC 7202]
MAKKTIIFDFDGTIANTFTTLVKIVNQLALEFNYPLVDELEVVRLSNLSSRDIIQQSPVALHKLPFLMKRIKKELNSKIGHLSTFEGMKDTLESLYERDYILGVITSNWEESVREFLFRNGLEDYFQFVYSSNNLFGKHRTINRVMRNHELPMAETFYVGDETRDIESAKKSNIRVVAVTWGFNSPEILQQYQPDYIINHPRDLLMVIDGDMIMA